MTLDAMDWVWRHSRTKGVARLVLLAVADTCTDDTATARMGTAEMVRRANATKGAVVAAVAAAVDMGELMISEPGAGSRAALYVLPSAVGYSRVSGRLTRPETQRSAHPTTTDLRSAHPTTTGTDSGPLTRPEPETPEEALWSAHPTGSGRLTDPHHSPIERVNEGGRERPAPAVVPDGIPDFARPLVDTLTASKVVVKWSLAEREWFTLHAMLQRSGVDMLAAEAVKVAARTSVGHARYFLRAWRDLPPAPAAGTTPVTAPTGPGADVIPLTAARPSKVQAAAAMFAAAAGLNVQEGPR